ncbi:MAG: ThuA domain-containing protein [Phycisphaerae bacterium]|nr:ThuA domain-containing protein [Phycisphaerae bacterium]
MAAAFTTRIAWGAAQWVRATVRDILRIALPPFLAVGAVGLVVAVVGAPSGAAVLDASHPAGTAGPADPATLFEQAASQRATEAGKPGVLIFSKTAGFRHDSIETGVEAMKDVLAPMYRVDATEDAAAFTPTNLERFRVVVFLNTTGDVLDDAQQRAFERFIEDGGGYVGIHAASDTEYDWPWYGKLVGAYFKSHPAIQEAVVRNESKDHPSMAGWPAELRRTDEWYTYRSNPRSVKGMMILASLDESSYTGGGMEGDHPTAWCHDVGNGRAWYTGGGHTKASFAEPLFRSHLKGGVDWASGDGAIKSKAP